MRSKLFILLILFFTFYYTNAQNDTDERASKLSELSLDQLMNIKVVTASGYLQTTAEAPSTITVITAQQIKDRGYEQLEDALRDVPGIDMIHINGYAPTLFYFRGMYGAENTRALFMIDGIVENNILGSNDLAGPLYSLHNVERIEIIWGPTSALYGANAFGGIINLITKKGAHINGVHAEKGEGSFNTSFEKLTLGLKQSNFEYSFAGTLYNTEGPVFANRDPEYHASFVANGYSFNGAFSYYCGKSKFTIGYRDYRTPMGWGTYSNSPNVYLGLPPQGNKNSDTAGILTRDFNGQRPGLDDSYLRTGFIQDEYKANEHLNLLARLIYRETGTGDDSYVYVTSNLPAFHDGRELINARITTYSNRLAGELLSNYYPSEKNKFTFGADFYRDNVEQGSRRTTFDPTIHVFNGDDTVINLNSTFLPRLYDIRYNIGEFFQYILNTNFLKNTSFTFGARDDYNSYFGNTFSPRIVAVNQLNDKFTFKLQFGKAFRAPTNLEIHQTPADSNFSIKTEKVISYEVNVIYTPSKKIRVQLNGFSNHLTDVIVLSNLVTLNTNKNPAIINIVGLEGTLDMDLSKSFLAFANFTWQDAEGQNLLTGVKRAVSAIAKIKSNAGITMRLPDNIMSISLSGNYVGMRPTPGSDPYGPVAGYFLTNCSINTGKILNTGITAGFEIRNVFNVTWLDPGFRTADGQDFSTVLPQPGRTFLFKINLDL